MNLFGKKKAAPAPKLSDSIQQLRDAQSMLDKREKHLEKQLLQCREDAKTKLRSKDKRGALFLLKRAKLYEQQVTQIYGKRGNIDVQIMALEGAASNKEIFTVMKAGKDALKQATAATDVDQVADTMEDINESIDLANEINDALSQQIGPQMDEDELNAELEEMEQEMVDKDLLAAPDIPVNIPAKPIQTQQQQQYYTTTNNVNKIDEKIAKLPNPPITVQHTTAKRPNVSEKEAKELKELEDLMGS